MTADPAAPGQVQSTAVWAERAAQVAVQTRGLGRAATTRPWALSLPLPRGAASRLSWDAPWGLLSIQVPGLQPWGPEETESWARLPAPLPGLASG